MAVAEINKTILDGIRNLVMQFSGVGDGAGDETNVVKVDVSELAPPADRVRVNKIVGAVNYGIVTMSWAESPNKPFLVLEGTVDLDYSKTGGLDNDADGNGDVLFSTSGFENNSNYNLRLEMIKKY